MVVSIGVTNKGMKKLQLQVKPVKRLPWHPRNKHARVQGFTILELLVLVIIVGVLASIAAPSWLGYFDRRRITTTQSDIFTAIRAAQVRAQSRRQEYQFSIREGGDGVVEWAVHPSTIGDPTTAGLMWEKAQSGTVELNTSTNIEGGPADGLPYYYLRFDYRGYISKPDTIDPANPPELVLSSKNTPDDDADDQTAKSIVIATLIGSLRKE